MFQIKFLRAINFLLFFTLAFAVGAQTKRRTASKKTVKKTAAAQQISVEDQTSGAAVPTVKKNVRPGAAVEQISVENNVDSPKSSSRPAVKENSIYFYEFSQPDFTVSKLLIEHDENGKGKITLTKKDFEQPETDPLQLSAATLERVKNAWSALDFLASTDNYQYEKDYSHLGTMKFTMKKEGAERAATFNWTANKDAKTLADEYRRIGQQFVWIFDIGVARENQPLNSPGLLDALDSLIRRNEISDAAQMIPLLKELSNDERLPLIARNHATKLFKKIEKDKTDEK